MRFIIWNTQTFKIDKKAYFAGNPKLLRSLALDHVGCMHTISKLSRFKHNENMTFKTIVEYITREQQNNTSDLNVLGSKSNLKKMSNMQ